MAPGRLILVGNQEGKGSCKNWKILGKNGFVEIGGAKVGDVVFDELGQETKITGVYPRGKQPIFNITFDDDVSIKVDGDHLWKIIPRKWQSQKGPQVVDTNWLFERYTTLSGAPKNRVQIPVVPGINFPHRNLLVDPYLLGILLGNGSFRQSMLSFSTMDREHIEYIGQFTGLTQSSKYDWRLKKSELNHHIEFLGLKGLFSYEKFVPKDYLLNDNETRLAILHGLMDTDGYQGKWLAEYVTTSKQLAEDVIFLIRSFGQKVSMREVENSYTHKGEKRIGRIAYRIQIKSPTIQLFRLKRKQPKNLSTRTPYRVIQSVEPAGVDETVCISVDSPLHTYVAQDFVVTHNTTIGAYETACYALGIHPKKIIRTPNTGWIITAKPLKEGVEKEILPKFAEIVGSQDIRAIKNNAQGIPYKIIWRTGSLTYILSAEQDDRVFEGSTIDFCWMDEPLPRSIYIAMRRGLMKAGGHWWWPMTPLDEPWIKDEIYDRAKEGKEKDIQIFEGNPGENVHVSVEERDRFKRTLTEDEIETRIYGRFQHLSGRVFKAYNPEVHRIPGFDIPRHWPVWTATDPHTRKPHATLFLACAPTGVFYVCNEIFVACPLDEYAGLCIEVADQYRVVERLIDTSIQEEDWKRESGREILGNAGWKTKLAQKKNKRKSGILSVNQLFSQNKLFVMEHCTRTHKELMLQVYKKSYARDGRILEEPAKNFDEMTDCLRYIFAERPDFEGPGLIKERPVPYKRMILPGKYAQNR